jgi:hypothetical protein
VKKTSLPPAQRSSASAFAWLKRHLWDQRSLRFRAVVIAAASFPALGGAGIAVAGTAVGVPAALILCGLVALAAVLIEEAWTARFGDRRTRD